MLRRIQSSIGLMAVRVLFSANAGADENWETLPLIENGNLADGWKHVGFGELIVDGDAVRTECDERGLGLAVWTKEKFVDCQIKVVFRAKDERSNAGVITRLVD